MLLTDNRGKKYEQRGIELLLAKQRKAFLILEEKYHALIRSAGSSQDKEIVAVQYTHIDDEDRVPFKNLAGLHTRLSQLKELLADKLYVKIIIPGKSGSSYNEAWNLTRDILSRYDNYYQKKK